MLGGSRRQPREFLVAGDLHQPRALWRVDSTCDPADVAAAWLQYRVVQTLDASGVSVSDMAACLANETANSIRGKLRGDRAMDLVDLIRWSMAIEPGLLTLMPDELTDLAQLLPPETARLLVSRTPGGYRRATFRSGTSLDLLDWQAISVAVSDWATDTSKSHLAWLITPTVLRQELIRLLQQHGVSESMIVPVSGVEPDGAFAVIDGRHQELVVPVCAAPDGGTADQIALSCATTVGTMWATARRAGHVIVAVVGSPAAVAMITGGLEAPALNTTTAWTLTLQHAEDAGVRGVDLDWPDLVVARLGDQAQTDSRACLYRLLAKVPTGEQ